MKFIHVADIHASKERKNQTEKILSTLLLYVLHHKIDYVFFAGDFWDSSISNTEASGFPLIVDKIKGLSNTTNVRMIYGTQSHEPDGSLDVFENRLSGIESTISKSLVFKTITLEDWHDDCDILYIPEPRRSKFIADSDEKSVGMIKDYLSQLKNIRKKDKPLIVVYHGEIMGAHYQNGIEATSPIALPKKLLQDMNADYYACGHIHDPQEVFKNCFYSGSAFPINMGETHNAGFNVVTIENGTTSVERVSFGFPVNMSFTTDLDLIPDIMKKDYTNKNVKLSVNCKERSEISGLASKIKEATHAESIKVVPVFKAITNVRAKEITQQKSVVDKLKTWASVNGIEATKALIQKAHKLEDTMLIKYSFPSHTFELVSVDVKGAVGFTNRKEMSIDFSKYHDGVIVLEGNNGIGKSTLIENCHPYPQMLTRSGKLRDHFYLKDSHRILIYKDETGLYYRISITMAANIKSGITKYYVETSLDGANWRSVPECDGNLDSYQKYINETFGSIDIFLKTSFYSKEPVKGYPDIASATKGERMELFAKLAGLDYYSTLCQSAKDSQKELESVIKTQSGLIDEKENIEKHLSLDLDDGKETEKELSKSQGNEQVLEKEVSELRIKNTEYLAYVKNMESCRLLAEQFKKNIKSNEELIDDLEKDKLNIAEYGKTSHEQKLYHDLMEKKNSLLESIKPFSDYIERYNKNIQGAQESKECLIKDTSSYEASKTVAESELKRLESSLTDRNVCPTCGAELTQEKSEELFSEIDKGIEKNKKQISAMSAKIKHNKKAVDFYESVIEDNQNMKNDDSDKRNQLNESLELTEDSIKPLVEKGIDKLCEYKPKYSEHDRKIAALKDENKSLELKIKGQGVDSVKEDVSDELANKEKEYTSMQKNSQQLETHKAIIEERIRVAKEKLNDIKAAELRINNNRKDCDDFKTLAKAFSNSGIQALELEAVVPDIADIANRILSKFYGDKFTLSFETLRAGVKCMVEDFNVMVYNSDNGRTYPIALLSSGEKVWVNLAIEYAFNIVNMQNTGSSFLTRFIDECDGSLDSESRSKYLSMIDSARIEGGAKKTILISHSAEIKNSADQTIEM